MQDDLKIRELYPPFGYKILSLLNRINKKYSVGVFQGMRTFQQQENLYNQGRTDNKPIVTNSPAGFSYHNYGIGADLVFLVNGTWNWGETNPWQELGDLGKSLGLEWGGDFKGFVDRPHFQLPIKMSLLDLKKIYETGGLKEVWYALDENRVGGTELA
jgi:peptidoglycan LD-endopeptidase CwlK